MHFASFKILADRLLIGDWLIDRFDQRLKMNVLEMRVPSCVVELLNCENFEQMKFRKLEPYNFKNFET